MLLFISFQKLYGVWQVDFMMPCLQKQGSITSEELIKST